MKMDDNQAHSEKRTTFILATSSIIITLLTCLGGTLDSLRDNQFIRWFFILASGGLFVLMVTLCYQNQNSESTIKKYKAFNKICVTISAGLLTIAFIGALSDTSGGQTLKGVQNEGTLSPTAIVSPTPLPSIDPTGKIAAGKNFTLLLRSDGKVARYGDAAGIDTSSWAEITQVAAYGDHAIGLCANGHVVTTGGDPGEFDISDWNGIKQVAACADGVIGVTPHGEVWFSGSCEDGRIACTRWTNIDRILGAGKHIVALTKSGEVLALGEETDSNLDTSGYANVVAGAAANDSTFVVFANGDAAETGREWKNEDQVSGWSHLVAIAGGDLHTVGLKGDGTLYSAGNNRYLQCDVSSWSNVVAICAGQYHTVGLCADGTLLATGLDTSGQCDVSGANYWAGN